MARIIPFEEHLNEYENWFVQNQFAYQSELKAIKAVLPSAGLGIEIGVGSGLFAAPLGIPLGLDPSPRMLALARQRGIKVVRGIGEQLPFKNGHFDFALMVTTVCFLDDLSGAFKEVARILKKGGVFLIGFIDRESPIGRQYQKFKGQSVFYRLAEFYSVQEILECLQEAGFGPFEFVQTIFHLLPEISKPEPLKSGHGQGSFVVIKALLK